METSLKQPRAERLDPDPESTPVCLDWLTGGMQGAPVRESIKKLADLRGIFRDEAARSQMNPETQVYRVRWWSPVAAGEEGGLFWGVTILNPGKVSDEYFMTHGHFHANRTRAEYYATVAGEGMLIRMDDSRRTWAETMTPGMLSSIDGRHAHRVVNVGTKPLIFWACWGSDAGYDYQTIRERGFGARVVEQGGRPAVIQNA